MSGTTGIEWTDATWNPVTGCTEVSPGCDHCYAKTFAERWRGTPGHYFEHGFDVQLRPDKLDLPLRWRKPRRIFVNSMSDLFHDQVPDLYIEQVFTVMARAPQHTFQILTKRHGRMRSLLNNPDFRDSLEERYADKYSGDWTYRWPLPNVWLGVSTENQQWADIRIPALLDTPAAVRFVSAEPLLGPIDLRQSLKLWTPPEDAAWRNVIPPFKPGLGTIGNGPMVTTRLNARDVLHWVIAGGESGPGARPMHPNWARGLRDQCQAAGVAFLFKQRGEWTWNEPGGFYVPTKPFTERVAVMHGAGMTAMTKSNPFNPFERGHPHWTTRIERVGKHRAGRELDGQTWDEYPTVGAV